MTNGGIASAHRDDACSSLPPHSGHHPLDASQLLNADPRLRRPAMPGAAFAVASPVPRMHPLSRSASAAIASARRAARTVATRRRQLCAHTDAFAQPSATPAPTAPSPAPSSPPSPAPNPLCDLHVLRSAPVPYDAGWRLQHAVCNQLKRDPAAPDSLILLEHEPVYTLGTASTLSHVLFQPSDPAAAAATDTRNGGWSAAQMRPDAPDASAARSPCGARLVRTERGGEVTFHGPGQLVAYPILNLRRHKQDLHWYLRALEGVVIDALWAEYGLIATRRDGLTGVWVDDAKVCAIGLKVSKWVTMHGLALNVVTDLDPFRRIVPCGIATDGLRVAALHELVDDPDVPPAQSMERARRALLRSFNDTFGPYDFEPCAEDETLRLVDDADA